jgi:hypothetical protein
MTEDRNEGRLLANRYRIIELVDGQIEDDDRIGETEPAVTG